MKKMTHRDFYLFFTFAGALAAAFSISRREWLWLALAPFSFVLDFFFMPKTFYNKTLGDLRSRESRVIAGVCIAILLSIGAFDQWERWTRQEILRAGISSTATISSVHPRYGKHSRSSLLLWYRHPEKGIQEIRHEGPLIQFEWFQPGQVLPIHYSRSNPKKIAIDGREHDILSGAFLLLFFLFTALWFGARLLFPDRKRRK